MNIRIHHACVATKDFDWYYNFFTNVFGMTVQKTRGEAPKRMIWFNEGIQLNELVDTEIIGTGCDHISLGVDDPVGAANLAIANGCRAVEGKAHWFEMPNGMRFEMKPY